MARIAMAAPVPTDRSPLGLGLAYGAFAALGLIWGTNFILVKEAAPSISPAQIVLLRVLFGFLPVLVFARVSGGTPLARLAACSSLDDGCRPAEIQTETLPNSPLVGRGGPTG